MSAKKMGLGRGLNTLIPKAPIVDEEDVEQVKKKVSRSSKTKKKEESNSSEPDMTQQMNKSMSYMMPIMAVSIAFVAPLGLALYWLVSNILMILERIVINKYVDSKEEKTLCLK